MPDDHVPDLVQLSILNDQSTPYEFVIGLLENVFGQSTLAARLTATTAHHYGEADCGLWPVAIADALLETANARIRDAGHNLAFSRTSGNRSVVFGQDQCGFCGSPADHVRAMYHKRDAFICCDCIAAGAAFLSAKVADTQFKFAHEVLEWHFGNVGLSEIETSVRSFPMRTRADLQLAFDQILTAKSVRQLGIKSGYRYQTVEFADLWEKDSSRQSIVPVQYSELDIGEDDPRRCVGTALWLLDEGGVKHCAFVSQGESVGDQPLIRVEIAVPEGAAGAAIAARYFQEIEAILKQARSYRGKVLSLEMDNRWQGLAGGIAVHRLRPISAGEVILPAKTFALLDRNILKFAQLRNRFKKIGQQTKKGLLFYGPPGTGKTHTIQYLAANLPGHTTLLVTADQVCLLHEYFSLARLLQPSILVIEDADLIARRREDMGSAGEEALLNKLLNEMDGLRQDSDIFFILTTNRPEQLETALAGRPGRIDQAIEFPLPDHDGRLRLADLYKGDLELDVAVRKNIVDRTEGVSAAFIKELMRRIAQQVLESALPDQPANEEHVFAALDEMLFDGGSLNAKLLGAGPAAA